MARQNLKSDDLYQIISDDLYGLIGMTKSTGRKKQEETFTGDDREAILRTVAPVWRGTAG